MDKSYDNSIKGAETARNQFIDTAYGVTTDSNGYAPSLISKDESCYICGYEGETARHEVFFGPNRTNSKRTGMWCYVCPACHNMIHRTDGSTDRYLKKTAQEIFESVRSHEDFMTIFGRSYL